MLEAGAGIGDLKAWTMSLPEVPRPSRDRGLAWRKPAKASSDRAGLAFDGNPTTLWESTQRDGKEEWLEVDLGAKREITRLRIDWAWPFAKTHEILVSEDGGQWRTLYATSGFSGGVEEIAGLSGSGRYVRLLCKRTESRKDGFAVYEMGIYGH